MELKNIYTLKLPIQRGEGGRYNAIRDIDLIVIGAGGTGSYFLSLISRVIKCRENDLKIYTHIFDGDIVEAKNTARQVFTIKDVGQTKVASLARRISNTYQIPVSAHAEFLESDNEILDLLKSAEENRRYPIIVGCVDSMQCRKMIDQAMKKFTGKAMWIDAGNEEFFGQVIINTVGGVSLNEFEQLGVDEGYFNLPSFVDIAPELFEGNLQKTSEISCAEHAMENVQNIGANIFSATCLFMVLNNLFADSGVSSSMIKFDAKLMFAHNTPITVD